MGGDLHFGYLNFIGLVLAVAVVPRPRSRRRCVRRRRAWLGVVAAGRRRRPASVAVVRAHVMPRVFHGLFGDETRMAQFRVVEILSYTQFQIPNFQIGFQYFQIGSRYFQIGYIEHIFNFGFEISKTVFQFC